MLTDNSNTAIVASLEAGKSIMKIYNSEFAVEHKDDKSPLTEADKSANEIINSYLKKTDIPVISEENKQIDFSVRKNWNVCWVVDPVDGTKEFIKRNGEFTVNIALVKNGKPILGVIYVPVEEILYLGNVIESMAFKVDLKNKEKSIETILNNKIKLRPKSKSNKLKVVGSRSHMNEETKNFIENLKNEGKVVDIVSKGSSLKFCLIAEGKADVYPRFAPTMEWDTAAGQAICKAVGIDVISQENHKPLLYNKENLLNPWFIVEN